MKKILLSFVLFYVALAVVAAPRRVALVVQNHTLNALQLPMSAFADTLTSKLSGTVLRVVNSQNVIGVEQNRTARGEVMPDASAQEIGRLLNAEGVVTASILEFAREDIGMPAVAHSLKIRVSLNLMDAATGETVVGISNVQFSKNYTAEQVQANKNAIYESLLHDAASKFSGDFLAKVSAANWQVTTPEKLKVFFGCNVLGADVQIDGLSYGTCPAQIAITPGIHTILVSYPPFYLDFKRKAFFNVDGQTYAVVLQITPEGEKQRRNGELFIKQKALIDAELARYKNAGEVEDYVRKVIADGTSVYWKNSFSRIVITEGSTEKIDFVTPKVDGGTLQRGLSSAEIGAGLRNLLEAK